MPKKNQTNRTRTRPERERDTMESGATGAHLGHDATRGMTGSGGEDGEVRFSQGHGRTSERDEVGAGSGSDLGLEGIRGDVHADTTVSVRDVEGDYRPDPAARGLGPGDPGYLAEEDDREPSVEEQVEEER